MSGEDPVPQAPWDTAAIRDRAQELAQIERQLAIAERDVAMKEAWAKELGKIASAYDQANQTPAAQSTWTFFDLPEEQQLVRLRETAIGMVLKSYYMVHEGMTESIFLAADKVVEYIRTGSHG